MLSTFSFPRRATAVVSSGGAIGTGPTPGRRSRLSSASSILERLHPSRWVRSSPPVIQHPQQEAGGLLAQQGGVMATPSHIHTKDKAKVGSALLPQNVPYFLDLII